MNTRLRVTVAEASIMKTISDRAYALIRYRVVGQPGFERLYENLSLEVEWGISELIELATASGRRRGSGVEISMKTVVAWLDRHGKAGTTEPVELTLYDHEYNGTRRLACRGPHVAVTDDRA